MWLRGGWRSKRGRAVVALSALIGLSAFARFGFNWLKLPRASAFAEALPRTAPGPGLRYRFARTFEVTRFLRGNIHTHTTLSDGNSSPERTVLWYASHGYQFLALTDHNLISDPARYATLHDPEFVVLSGEEITMMGGGRQVHVNALCTRSRISGGAFPSQSAALASAIDRVLLQGGVAIVNHPNFDWALSPEDVIDARDAALLEIASGHPYVHTAGNNTHPSHEELWDKALSAGANYMGVAVDDVHRIDVSGNPQALPGKAWVEVFAAAPTAKEICAALSAGELYSSTGVELKRIAVTESEYVLEPARRDVSVVFVGNDGRVLAHADVEPATGAARYALSGGEGYVRARLEARDGARAWTPAVRVVRAMADALLSDH